MWIKGLSRKHGIEIKKIRLENSGENKSTQKECDKQNVGVILEFPVPGTPQHNSVLEKRIPRLIGSQGKGEFCCEVFSTATNLDNIMVRQAEQSHHTTYSTIRIQSL